MAERLSDERLAEIRDLYAEPSGDCRGCRGDGLIRLLVSHIDAQQERIDYGYAMDQAAADEVQRLQERIDALEAEVADLQSATVGTQAADCAPERAEMRREFRIIEADGTVYAEGDVALEDDYTRDLQPGDALYRRDTYTGPWVPVQDANASSFASVDVDSESSTSQENDR